MYHNKRFIDSALFVSFDVKDGYCRSISNVTTLSLEKTTQVGGEIRFSRLEHTVSASARTTAARGEEGNSALGRQKCSVVFKFALRDAALSYSRELEHNGVPRQKSERGKTFHILVSTGGINVRTNYQQLRYVYAPDTVEGRSMVRRVSSPTATTVASYR